MSSCLQGNQENIKKELDAISTELTYESWDNATNVIKPKNNMKDFEKRCEKTLINNGGSTTLSKKKLNWWQFVRNFWTDQEGLAAITTCHNHSRAIPV